MSMIRLWVWGTCCQEMPTKWISLGNALDCTHRPHSLRSIYIHQDKPQLAMAALDQVWMWMCPSLCPFDSLCVPLTTNTTVKKPPELHTLCPHYFHT